MADILYMLQGVAAVPHAEQSWFGTVLTTTIGCLTEAGKTGVAEEEGQMLHVLDMWID